MNRTEEEIGIKSNIRRAKIEISISDKRSVRMSSDAQDERRHVKESDDHKHRRKKNSKDDKQQVRIYKFLCIIWVCLVFKLYNLPYFNMWIYPLLGTLTKFAEYMLSIYFLIET